MDDDIAGRARALSPSPVLAVRPAGSGGNSRIYRVDTRDGPFALKSYPSRDQDPRDRLGVEFAALSFMHRHGIAEVPRPVAADTEARIGLYTWMDGATVRQPGMADVDAALAFLGRLHRLRDQSDAAPLPPASEACLSGREIVHQIDARLLRLRSSAVPPPQGDQLHAFLAGQFEPMLAETRARAERGYHDHRLDFDRAIAVTARSLCASDFGFHNILRRGDGRLAFVDFEYFGWDDPVKLAADFLLHPATRLDHDLKSRIAAGCLRLYQDDATFPQRLQLLYPLFGLRWCLILLNEFLPERWAIRVHADREREWPATAQRQLDRARCLWTYLKNLQGRFPYGE